MLASLILCRSRNLLWSSWAYVRMLGGFALCLLLADIALGQQTVRLEGKVRTDAGATLKSGVNVRIETDEGQLVAEQPANSEGSFHFEGLPKQQCRLVVTADGFETHQESLDLGYGATMVVRWITLRPSPKSAGQAAPSGPRSDTLAPKGAKKEYEIAANDLLRKDLDRAQAHLEKAVKEYPCYARAQTDLAALLEQKQDLAGAEAALKKARGCDPDYIDPYIVLGQMLNSQKRFSDAAPVLEEGVRRSPASWQFYYQLGVAYYGLNQYNKAADEYNKVNELSPSPPTELHVKLADVYLREKAYDKAYAQMDQYVKAEPNGRFAPKIKHIMQEMKAAGILNRPEAAKQ